MNCFLVVFICFSASSRSIRLRCQIQTTPNCLWQRRFIRRTHTRLAAGRFNINRRHCATVSEKDDCKQRGRKKRRAVCRRKWIEVEKMHTHNFISCYCFYPIMDRRNVSMQSQSTQPNWKSLYHIYTKRCAACVVVIWKSFFGVGCCCSNRFWLKLE